MNLGTNVYTNIEIKFSPLYAMAYMGNRGRAAHNFNAMESGKLHTPATLSPEKKSRTH
jgi:hypothetical protein